MCVCVCCCCCCCLLLLFFFCFFFSFFLSFFFLSLYIHFCLIFCFCFCLRFGRVLECWMSDVSVCLSSFSPRVMKIYSLFFPLSLRAKGCIFFSHPHHLPAWSTFALGTLSCVFFQSFSQHLRELIVLFMYKGYCPVSVYAMWLGVLILTHSKQKDELLQWLTLSLFPIFLTHVTTWA